MLKKTLTVLALLVIALVVVILMQPSEFRVTRTATISAPPATIFPLVNDLHNWRTWSPWEKMDPAMKRSYEGAPAGQGASYSWAGNQNVGEGRMTITDSRSNELILIKLEFFKPFAATNTTEFVFKPEGNQTTVTWSMSGKNNFMAKAVHLFMDMDKMVGSQFAQGLANMKVAAESKVQK